MDIKAATERTMLSLTVWREARGASHEAKVAVAYSILERVAHPGWWGTDICSIVSKKYQYSSMGDPRDPQLINWPQLKDPSWVGCWDAVASALDQTASNPAPKSNSYYDDSIPPPAWATPANFVKKVGRLNFHKVPSPAPRTNA